ncbi:MAG: amidohydrolase family protein [Cyclobacteriaceae bacterium]
MKIILTHVLLLAAFACPAQGLHSSTNRQIVFADVNVISMEDEEKILEHQVVVTRNGRITAIGTRNTIKYDQTALVIDGSGKYLIPGLAEMHAHVPPNDDLESMKEVLRLFALNGITTIRGMLGHPKHLELREAIEKGEILGPHFHTTGPSFNGMSVKAPEDGAAMVRRQKEAGYDYLKLHPGLTRPKFDAIASAAKEVSIPFAGHVSYGVGVWRAIEAGYSSIDHLDGFVEGLVPGIEKIPEPEAGLFGMFVADKADRSRIPKLMRALKENNIWVVPTQSLAERWFHPDFSGEDFKKDPHMVYIDAGTVQQWIDSKANFITNPQYSEEKMKEFIQLRRDLILECEKHGVRLLLGCDAPQIFNVPGFSTHHELEYLVRAGLSPFQALRTGTLNVARYLNKKDAGMVKAGMVSDLILLHANPLASINNTRQIAGVMIGDKWMDKEYIDAELKKLVKQ